jgi:Tetratricopeptide repeat
MKSKPAAFLIAFAAAGVTLFLSVVATNVFVDPFGLFYFVNIDGFNAQRLKAASEARMVKAIQVCLDQPTAVVMGTSRVEVGMNPVHPGWEDGARPYSLALAGTGLAELDMTFRHLVQASPAVKQVAIGVDFLMFNANREAHVFGAEVLGFDRKRLLLKPGATCLRSVSSDAFNVLGVPALRYSLATIGSQMTPPDSSKANYNPTMVGQWIAQYDRRGYRGDYYDAAFKWLWAENGARENFDDSDHRPGQETYYVDKIWRPSPEKRYCFTRAEVDTFAVFRSMIDFAYQSGVDVRLFINPIHARMLVAIREAGLWPTYEAWKRGISEIVEDEGRKLGRAPIPLWDFSGFNTVTTEAIPPIGVTTSKMRFWWEPSHYQSLVGAMMLDRILGYSDPKRDVPADFGVRLDRTTIDAWIDATRKGALDYAVAEPRDVKIVTDAIDHLMQGEEGANCGEDVQALYDGLRLRDAGDAAGAATAFARGEALHEAQRRLFAEMDAPFREAGFYPLLNRIKAGEKIFPRLASAAEYQNRAQARLDAGDFDGALEDFTQAYKITPYNDVLKYLLGYAHDKRGEKRLGQGDLMGAEADFTATVDFWLAHPQASLYFLRGSTRLRLGKEASAIEDFVAGLKLDPGNQALLQLRDRAQASLAAKQD